MKFKFLLVLIGIFFSTNIFAADQAVKEETNPPVAEAVITPAELQPIVTAAAPTPAPTSAPAAPTANQVTPAPAK